MIFELVEIEFMQTFIDLRKQLVQSGFFTTASVTSRRAGTTKAINANNGDVAPTSMKIGNVEWRILGIEVHEDRQGHKVMKSVPQK